MRKVIRFFTSVSAWVSSDTALYAPIFPNPDGRSSGIEVYNAGPDPAEFAPDPESLGPLRVLDPGCSTQILWAAPAIIYVKGNAELTAHEIEV